jgi:hypothetical protein
LNTVQLNLKSDYSWNIYLINCGYEEQIFEVYSNHDDPFIAVDAILNDKDSDTTQKSGNKDHFIYSDEMSIYHLRLAKECNTDYEER